MLPVYTICLHRISTHIKRGALYEYNRTPSFNKNVEDIVVLVDVNLSIPENDFLALLVKTVPVKAQLYVHF